MKRKKTREIKIGNTFIGGSARISVQSMTNTQTKDVGATVRQIKELEHMGCDIVRVSLYDMECAECLPRIKAETSIPIVGDIHFDHRVAVAAIKNGVDKIRLNPGNIGNESKIREVAMAAADYGIPIRVGANSGSIEKSFSNLPRVEALVESAMKEVLFLEKNSFENIVIAIKSSDPNETVEANRLLSSRVDYPIHLGVTEAGPEEFSLIKSSYAIGTLLSEGIGDTIRYSISDNPVKEVSAGHILLRSMGLEKGARLISCPTCSRTCIDVEGYSKKVGEMIKTMDKDITVAIMGCVVNGIGEGKEADIGIAGTKYGGTIFKKGKIVGSFREDELFDILNDMMRDMN